MSPYVGLLADTCKWNRVARSLINLQTSNFWMPLPCEALFGATRRGLHPRTSASLRDATDGLMNASFNAIDLFNAVYMIEKFECVDKRFPLLSGSGPQCSCAVNDPPSTTVTLSCSVDFAGSDFQPNHPIFTWNNRTSVVQQDLPIPLQISSYLKESTSQLQISSDDPTTYTCRLTFSPSTPTQLNYVAVKAPDFTASCDIYSKSACPTDLNTTRVVFNLRCAV